MIIKNLEVKTIELNNKIPIAKNGVLDASFTLQPSTKSYGVACGATKNPNIYLVVIDVDNHQASNGLANWGAIQYALTEEELNTLTIKTPSGGYHYYYTLEREMKLNPQLSIGIDCKAQGGYVVGPYSQTDRGTYLVENDADIKPLPAYLFKMLTTKKNENNSTTSLSREFTEEEREQIITNLSENRDWDSDYNTRLSVLTAMKYTGFDILDFLSVIDGSPSDKKVKDWKASWNSLEDKQGEVGDYLLLIKYSKTYIPDLIETTVNFSKPKENLDINDYPNVQFVGTKEEAIELSKKMFVNFYKINTGNSIVVRNSRTNISYPYKDFTTIFTNRIVVKEKEKSTEYFSSKLFKDYVGTDKLISKEISTPLKPSGVFQDKFGFYIYNNWKSIEIEPATTFDISRIPNTIDYITNVLASGREDVSRTILRFMADTIYEPENRSNVFSLNLYSTKQGTGKTTFFELMNSLLGEGRAVKPNSLTELVNSENHILEGKSFVFIDEEANSYAEGVRDKLKDFITGTSFQLKKKYYSARTVENFTRWCFSSNSLNSAPVELNDRRFFPIKISAQRQEDKEYFRSVKEEWTEENLSHLLKYLEQFAGLTEALPTIEEKKIMKKLNLDSVGSFLYDALDEDNEYSVFEASNIVERKEEIFVKNLKQVYELYKLHTMETRSSKPKNFLSFKEELIERYGVLARERTSLKVEGTTIKAYKFSDKQSLQKFFLEKGVA